MIRASRGASTAASEAQPATDPSSQFFTASDGVKIPYLTLGNSGSWVVLIHGFADTADRMWFRSGIAAALARNHRVVALDNRNHGKGDKPQPDGPGRPQDVPAEYIDSIVDFINGNDK